MNYWKLPKFRQDDVQDVSMMNQASVGNQLKTFKNLMQKKTHQPQEGQKTIIQPKRSCGSHDGFPAKGSSPGEIRPLFVPGFQFDEALSFTQSYEKKK